MKKVVLIFGVLSGAVSSAMMLLTFPFMKSLGYDKAEILGYTSLVLSALFIFFGVRSYRENVGDGRITFGRAFLVGTLITLVASLCYVATFELVYFKLMPDFGDKFVACMIDRVKTS